MGKICANAQTWPIDDGQEGQISTLKLFLLILCNGPNGRNPVPLVRRVLVIKFLHFTAKKLEVRIHFFTLQFLQTHIRPPPVKSLQEKRDEVAYRK